MEHFEKDTEFNTYKDLLAAKYRYEQATKTLLTTKQSAKYGAGDPRRDDLVYSRIQYQCKAGEERKSTSKGNRAVSTGKMNCPVLVTLRVREGKLCVVHSMLQHVNHTQDAETFMKYPENLRLKPNEIRYAKELLKKGFCKKTIKAKLKEKRGGKPLSLKFWAQIHRSMKGDASGNDNDNDDDNNDDFADDTFDTSLPSENQTLIPEVEVKQEVDIVLDTDDNHASDYDDDGDHDDRSEGHNGSGDPLSDMFQKCATDDSVKNRTNDKLKKDFDNWFKDLIPGEKLSYNEWLWQLEFNFPSLDKLNFIKYGIILGMTILNKYYFDGSMKIDGNGIKEVGAEFGRKRKRHLRPVVSVKKYTEEEDDKEEDDDDDDYLDNENDDFQRDDEPVHAEVDHSTNDKEIKPTAGSNNETSQLQARDSGDSSSTSKVMPQTRFDSVKTTVTNSQPNEPIKCKMCPEEFPTHSQLYHHMCKFHTGHIGLNCPICNKRFQYSRNLNQHLALVHVDNVPSSADVAGRSICEICGASFDKMSSLRSHVRYVHSAEKFYCQYCNRKLSSKKSLREHIQFQHELTFVTHECEECQRIFKYKSSYRLHMKKQHNIRFG